MKRGFGIVLTIATLVGSSCSFASDVDAVAPEAIRAESLPIPPGEASPEPSSAKFSDGIAVQPQTPATLTITTGGGSKITDRVVALFGKTVWRVYYPDAQGIEKEANQLLAADGYDVEKVSNRQGWYVETVALGNPDKFSPRGDGNEESKAGFERGGRVIAGFLVGILTGGAMTGGNLAGSATSNNPNAKYITRDMVANVPPGAKKILLTRVVSPVYRAQQEVLTIAYSDVTDEELRRINAGPLLEILGLKIHSEKSNATNTGDGGFGGGAVAYGVR